MEYLVEVLQDLVEDQLLQSWFELLEKHSILKHSSIILKSGSVEVTDAAEY